MRKREGISEVPEELGITFAGIRMRSPLGIAPINMPLGKRSAITPELHAEVLLKHAEAGAGFIYVPGASYITKEIISELKKRARPRETSKAPGGMRFMKVETPGFGVEGLYHINAPMIPPPENRLTSFDLVRRIIEILKKRLPENVPIIASMAPLGDFPETAVISAKKLEEVGVDLIEVNVSCPAIPGIDGAVDYYLEKDFPLLMVGALLGDHPDLVEKIAKEVVSAVDIPVGFKLPHLVGFPRIVGLARNLRDAGIKYLEILNQLPTIAPPDIYDRGKSAWPYVGGNPFVAASGGFLRMGCYANVAGISKFAPGIDIAASGGLLTPEHAVEVMMLGGKLVEYCTGMLFQGRSLLRQSTEFLKNFIVEQGYEEVEKLVGIGVPHITPLDTVIMHTGKVVAEVDPSKCQESGVCTDNICIAIERDGGKAKIRAEACNGCGLCVATCPNQAITLKLCD